MEDELTATSFALSSLKKNFEGSEDVDGVPLGTFSGAISKNKKKILVRFFEGVDYVDGVPLDTLFGAISKNKIKKMLSDFFRILKFFLKFFYLLK